MYLRKETQSVGVFHADTRYDTKQRHEDRRANHQRGCLGEIVPDDAMTPVMTGVPCALSKPS